MKEYMVTLYRREDLDDFYNDMETPGGDLYIPDRAVDLQLRRQISRVTNYMLTPEEAEKLKEDPRVRDVEDKELFDLITWEAEGYEDNGTWRRNGSFFPFASEKNWGILRHTVAANPDGDWGRDDEWDKTADVTITASGKNVDVLIVDGSIVTAAQSHPEFAQINTVSDYVDTTLASNSSNGAVFDRQITARGLKMVVAGAVGGQTAVPDMWAEKTAKMVTLLIDPTYPLINVDHQINLIKTLQGATGTIHAGLPAVQRIAYGGGSEYSPNFLTDTGAAQYAGYQTFLDNHVHNDMVWYANISGPSPSVGDRDIEELVEHLMHTIHLFGIMGAVPGSETAVNWLATNNVNWQTTELHLAMKEAIDGGFFDPSGYASDWATVDEAAEVAYKEYMYLINWSMWDMSTFWDGGSLSPEWSDSVKTPSGMLTNNPKGYALFKSYFEPVLSKPDFDVLRDIFRDNDLGPSYYTPASNGAPRIKQFNWFSLTNQLGLGSNGTYDYTTVGTTSDSAHGCHVAGTVAGNTKGWARDANIYNIEFYYANAVNQVVNSSPLTPSTLWDYIREWHNTKPINPVTGRRNPTISNHSYGSTYTKDTLITNGSYDSLGALNFRGTLFNAYGDFGRGLTDAELEARGVNVPANGNWKISAYSTSLQSDIEDAIDDGIMVCISSGNHYQKSTITGDQDFGNLAYLEQGGSFVASFYTNRGDGSASADNRALVVGNLYDESDDKKSPSSVCGNIVDIHAAGSGIVSSVYGTGNVQDSRNNSFYFSKYSGTSMASPQVSGVLALLAESNPSLTQADANDWLSKNGTDDLMQDTGTDDCTDFESLQGAANKILRWINQRPETGNSFPKINIKARPNSGRSWPRPRIRVRG